MTTNATTNESELDLTQPSRSIWKDVPSLLTANEISGRSLISHLGIEFLELGEDHLVARMPVDHRTRQPLGLLHGGASIVLAGVMNVPYLFNPGVNLLSFLFSAGIGVLFGYFPARRAAHMDPIDALRHE